MKILSIFSLTILLILTTGCAGTFKNKDIDAQENTKTKVAEEEQETFEISGKTYYVKESSESYTQRGQASWYGHPFHGRRTASGERFNMYEMTAAHNSLPLPSYVRVTNLDNDESIIVKVNDRMPKHKTRIIDLSQTAAKEIGIHRAGIGNVEIERIYLEEIK